MFEVSSVESTKLTWALLELMLRPPPSRPSMSLPMLFLMTIFDPPVTLNDFEPLATEMRPPSAVSVEPFAMVGSFAKVMAWR
ncbi:MAG: hypothetical protein Q605_AUC00964G0002 [Actinomyces urogenitalis DORA_12]|uniref:Uncharacterized protein n=1 Tax=Actinomyces urogenitalis DORA_12 TaxID=1403939 RepID=W1VF16_9ACTO|nr:MAG: hypothetical protein Q605_AUC00964G0002 [Actinomyces urogenitalis DORA_12]